MFEQGTAGVDQDAPKAAAAFANTLPQNQKTFIAARANRLADTLRALVRTHNPEFSVDLKLDPDRRTMRLDVLDADKTHVAGIEGTLDLKWAHLNGRGKDLAFTSRMYVTDKDGTTRMESAGTIDARNSDSAHLFFKQMYDMGLPSATDTKLRREFAQNARPREEENGDDGADFGYADAEFPARERGLEEMRREWRLIFAETRTWQQNFRNRYVKRNPIFKNADFSYDPEDGRLSIALAVNPDYKNGSPSINLKGAVSVHWMGNNKARIKLLLDSGFRPNGQPVGEISFAGHKIRGEASKELIKFLISHGMTKGEDVLFGPECASDAFNGGAAGRRGANSCRDFGPSAGRGDRPRREGKRDSRAQFRHDARAGKFDIV